MEEKTELAERVHRFMNKTYMLATTLQEACPDANCKVDDTFFLGLGYFMEEVAALFCNLSNYFHDQEEKPAA